MSQSTVAATVRTASSADKTLTDSGCQRVDNEEGNYLCPVKGMLGLCQTMLKNNAVLSCALWFPLWLTRFSSAGIVLATMQTMSARKT